MQNLYNHPTVRKFVHEVDNPSFAQTQIALNSRIVVNGGTGSGKTHAVVNYILNSPNTFQHIVCINQGIEEPLYETLRDKLGKKGTITFFTVDNYPTAKELAASRENDKDQYLVIFDDIIADLNTQKKIDKLKQYMIFGRKLFLTSFVLTQDYHSLPKPLRGQMSHLILLRLNNDMDFDIIIRNFRTLGVTKEQLVQIYKIATTGPFNFLKIDCLGTDPNKKFTRNFTDAFHLETAIDRNGKEYTTVLAGPWYNKRKAIGAGEEEYGTGTQHKKRKRADSEDDSSGSDSDDSS